MSDVITLEFAAGTADQYAAVNKQLGIDPTTGAGEWPAALQSHVASFGPSGLVVTEVWESKAAQAEFMGRLTPAFTAVGMPEPTRIEWSTLLGRHTG